MKHVSLFALSALALSSVAFADPVVFVDAAHDSETPGWGVTHFQNIADGIAAVDAGGLVNVAAGAYTLSGPITIDKSLTINGPQAGVDPHSFDGSRTPGDTATEAVINAQLLTDGFVIAASDVSIDGVEFIGGPLNAFVRTDNTGTRSNISVLSSIFRRTAGNTPAAVLITDGEGISVSGNRVDGLTGNPGSIAFNNVGGGIISDNEVSNTSSGASHAGAINVGFSSEVSVIGNHIHTNIAKNGISIGDTATEIDPVSNVLVQDNVIKNFAQAGISVVGTDIVIDGNDISEVDPTSGISRAGIYIRENFDATGTAANITITRNWIHDNNFHADAQTRNAGIRLQRIATGAAGTITIDQNMMARNFNNKIGVFSGYSNDSTVTGQVDIRNNWWNLSTGPAANQGSGYTQMTDACDGSSQTLIGSAADAAGRQGTSTMCFAPWSLFQGTRTAFEDGGLITIPQPGEGNDLYSKHSVDIPAGNSGIINLFPSTELSGAAPSSFEVVIDGDPIIENVTATVQYQDSDLGPNGVSNLQLVQWNGNSWEVVQGFLINEEAMTISGIVALPGTFAVTDRPYLLGDATGNGIVNNQDAVQIYRIHLGLDDIEDFDAEQLDVNNDGVVDLADAEIVHQYAMGLIDSVYQPVQ